MSSGEVTQKASVSLEPAARLNYLHHLMSDLAEKLKGHQTALGLRGMAIPPGMMEGISAAAVSIQSMTKRLGNSDIELQQLRELARTSETVNSQLDLGLVLIDVVDTVISLTGAERCYIILKNPDTGELEYRVARDKNQRDLASNEVIISHTIVEKVASEGELVVTVDAVESQELKDAESVANLKLRSVLCVPLKRKGEVTGMIYADNRMKPNLFTEREQRVVNAFAHQAAIAIENARLFERLRVNLSEIIAMKDLLDEVFASIASGVITVDSQNHIITMNAAAGRILAVDSELAIGQNLYKVLPPLYEGFDRLLENVRVNNVNQTVEVEPVLAGRGQVNLDLKLAPLKDGSQVTQGVAIVVDDMTEVRQRQAQLSVVRRYLPPEMVDNIKTIDELELGGVEREISVVFCDVRGFTTFSETLEPEVLMETINQYLTASSNAIQQQGGIVDKFMGDAAVGLFNTQLNPQEDHALRAVLAGLIMVENVNLLHPTMPPEHRLFYGIGVHSGAAILGNVGSPRRKEFTAIGNTLQFAKLLQENALGGELLISEETYQLVKNRVIAEALPPRKVKDQPDFSVMYKVHSLR